MTFRRYGAAEALARARGLTGRLWSIHHYSASGGALVLHCPLGGRGRWCAYLIIMGLRSARLATIFRLTDIRMAANRGASRNAARGASVCLSLLSEGNTHELICDDIRLIERMPSQEAWDDD